jgi:hypothetical protein
MSAQPTFEQVFRFTGLHLGAVALGFAVAGALFAPKARKSEPLPARTVQILELRTQAQAAASASAGPALARAEELCRALQWPACDRESIRQMGQLK